MKKALRYSLRVFVIAVALMILVWVIMSAYIYYNKQDLLARISSEIKKRTYADVQVKDLGAGLIRTFPFVSVRLSDVVLKDTLWSIHHNNFFEAKQLYIRVDLFSLIGGKPRVGKVIAENGTAYIYIDSSGISNTYIFHSKDKKKNKNPYPDIVLNNIRLIYVNPSRNKLYDLKAVKLNCNTETTDDKVILNIKTNMHVNDLGFNTQKGSYLKNKTLSGNFRININRVTKELVLKNVLLKIQGDPFVFNGKFLMAPHQRQFLFTVQAKDVFYSRTIALLPEKVHQKLSLYNVEKRISLIATINGEMKYKSQPKVVVKTNIVNNNISTPAGLFTNSSFAAYFTNEMSKQQPRIDENSALIVSSFSGNWETLPVTSKQIRISNLKQPFLQCDVVSDFKMQSLNELMGSSTLQFLAGTGKVNVVFKGSLAGKDTIGSAMYGTIQIKDADLKYLPRNFTFSDCSAALNFHRKDLSVNQFKATAGDTKLVMDGEVKDFLELLEKDPERLSLRWKVFSPHIYLKDFKTFLAKRSINSSPEAKKAKLVKTAQKIDRMLTNGDIFLNIATPKLNYKKFAAADMNADILLTQNQIALRNVALAHANGTMTLRGSITESSNGNAVSLNTALNKMNITTLFNAFDDFGQDAVTHKNLKGIISANVLVNTVISDDGDILPGSMDGKIDFLVQNGELNNFEPLEKISQTALKKQNFSQIQFADLKNTLVVKGTAILIDRMEIRSTAIVLFVEGVYDVKKGTDMFIKVPIRNLTKSNENIDLIEEDAHHGPSIRLRAKTGDDGKLKVSWDPFRKGKKARKEMLGAAPSRK